jgi:Do/DeqQ family serine protease
MASSGKAVMCITRPMINRLIQTLLLTLFAVAQWSGPTIAQKRPPTSRQEITLSFAPLVKKAAPTVVNIYTKRVVQRRQSPFLNDPFFRQFFGNAFNFGAPRKRVENSLGSGVIVRPQGIIVTNHHVIDKADQITVVLSDRRELDAKVILSDEKTDLAVLRVDVMGEALPFLKLRDSDDLEVGDLVLAIGNPFGVGQTVTSGIVSALARAAENISDFSFFIQTDAAINPGNSGGALITLDGRLAGINTAIYSRSGGSQGIGFAIPANMVGRVVDDAVKGTKIVRPWFGAAGQAVTMDLAGALGLKRPVGVLVSDIYPGGPAASARLAPGDVIIEINGREVPDPRALRFRIATLAIGGSASLTVIRLGKTIRLKMPLEAPPEIPPRRLTQLKGKHPLSGVTVANLSPALAEELSLAPTLRGVIVLGISRRSPARRLGLKPGDILAEINSKKTAKIADAERLLRAARSGWRISVIRDGRVLTVVIDG